MHGVLQLELIDDVDRSDFLIAYPVTLEEWLMEGSYNKVLFSGLSQFVHGAPASDAWTSLVVFCRFCQALKTRRRHITPSL
jgi:hypothetical protein